MTFALHTGRAIEGAVGSEFKVDALYLSPDTQITLRIDELCDVYDRVIMMTGDLNKILSEKAQSFTRKIDTIVLNESPTTSRVSRQRCLPLLIVLFVIGLVLL